MLLVAASARLALLSALYGVPTRSEVNEVLLTIAWTRAGILQISIWSITISRLLLATLSALVTMSSVACIQPKQNTAKALEAKRAKTRPGRRIE